MRSDESGEWAQPSMDRLERVVVGIDFSVCSRNALIEAFRIARWNETQLHIVHIVEDEVVMELHRALERDAAEIVGLREAALTEFIMDVRADLGPVDYHSEVIVGHPFHETMRVVMEGDANLLVLGAQGHSRSRRTSTGALATKCVRKSPCKVLLVRDTKTSGFQRVVAAVDLSGTSRLALHEAARLVRQDGGTLHVVNVYAPPWKHFAENEASHTLVVSEDQKEHYYRKLKGKLADFIYECLEEFEGLKVVSESIEAVSEGWGITDYLHAVHADLVVLGTRGRSLIRTLTMGSISEHVVCESPCSVLTIKPAGFADTPPSSPAQIEIVPSMEITEL